MPINNLIAAAEADGGGTMTEFLAGIGEVTGWIFQQIPTVSSAVMKNPILFVPFGLMLAGAAVGFTKRLAHL